LTCKYHQKLLIYCSAQQLRIGEEQYLVHIQISVA